MSRGKVAPFIEKFQIPMHEYDPGPFQSFNDFFIRKFQPDARSFVTGSNFPAFAEGRYLGFESVTAANRFPVKGIEISLTELIGGAEKAKPFLGGPLLIARLCPVDYHRYHYPADGRTIANYEIPGALHSVNPIALALKHDILMTNHRRVALLETADFGKLAYIEVGATCVGRIVQSHDESQDFTRGDEKGYFLFGGSTVVLVGEQGKWSPDQAVLERSSRRMETLFKLGQKIN